MLPPEGHFHIKAMGEAHFEAALDVAYRAFGTLPHEDDRRYFEARFDTGRALGAFVGDVLVGTSTVLPLELTLPGGAVIPAGGLAWVATLPGYGRRGVCRGLVTAQKAAMRARGEMVSVLTSSSGDLYQRFGYGPATALSTFTVDRRHSAFVSPYRSEPEDAVWRVRPLGAGEARAVLPWSYERLRLLDAGAVSRSPAWWDEHLADTPHFFQKHPDAGPLFHAVVEGQGRPQGYVSYRFLADAGQSPLDRTLYVEELFAATPQARAALWRYCLDLGPTARVTCDCGRADEPLRWLLADPRRFVTGDEADHLWLALLDVAAALEARGYAADGELVLGVREHADEGGRRSAGPSVYHLIVERPGVGSARCEPIAAPPEIEIDAVDLASAYLGTVPFQVLAAAGRVHELSPGACARADLLFRNSTAPYCATRF